jgi:hypothetical protein
MRPTRLVAVLLLDELVEIQRFVEPPGFERLAELATQIRPLARVPEHPSTPLEEKTRLTLTV